MKVTDKNGKRIGVKRSLLRSFPIVFCFFGEPSQTADLWKEILTYVVTPLWVSLAYFAVFLPCCRTTHDFIFGTFISDIENKDGVSLFKIPNKSIIIVVLTTIALLGWRYFSTSSTVANKPMIDNLKRTQAQIIKFQEVEDASIQLEGDKFTIVIITKNNPSQSMLLAAKASCLLITNMALENSNQEIQSIIMRGFDMKIYHSWETFDNTFTVVKWLSECKVYK